MSVPTDCCQRDERRGWMGDAALGASVNFYNHEMTAFCKHPVGPVTQAVLLQSGANQNHPSVLANTDASECSAEQTG